MSDALDARGNPTTTFVAAWVTDTETAAGPLAREVHRLRQMVEVQPAIVKERDALTREVQASRKLIADLRALHQPMWVSEQAKAAGKDPWVCELCGTGDGSWPCESVLMIDGAGL